MLDDFKNGQLVAYKTLINAIKKNHLSHAYLFETNNYKNGISFVYSFVKALLCPYNYTNENLCNNCSQCHKIDSHNLIEIKEIEADGQWIKKEQLLELQEEFSKKSIETKYKIYVIKNAEKLNISAANSLLKFLEEPEENIIALLLTDNIYQVLSTIVSRCQVITLKNIVDEKENTLLEKIKNYFNLQQVSDDKIIEKVDKITNFVNYYEDNKIDTLLYLQKLWHEYFNTKDEIELGFQIMIIYYKDILNYNIGRKMQFFEDYQDKICKINIEQEDIIRKLEIIIKLQDEIKYNINNQLLMDKLIIELEGGMINE